MRSLIAFVVLALLSGCASTSLESVRDPQFAGKHYERIFVVSYRDNDFAAQRENEGAFVGELAKIGVKADACGNALPPTMPRTEDEIIQYAADSDYDAILLVCMKDAYREFFGEPAASITHEGETAYVYGPYTASWPREQFEVVLIDMDAGEVAWRCSSHTRGNGWAKHDDMVKSLAEKATSEMRQEGLVGGLAQN